MSTKRQVRASFRAAVFARDRYRCVVCGTPGLDRQGADAGDSHLPELDAHHITDRTEMPNGGYVLENGISLCDGCHRLAEAFHSTGVAAPGYAPVELYARIGSSFEAARHSAING